MERSQVGPITGERLVAVAWRKAWPLGCAQSLGSGPHAACTGSSLETRCLMRTDPESLQVCALDVDPQTR